MITDCAQKKE